MNVSQPLLLSVTFNTTVIKLSSKAASAVLNCTSKLVDPLGGVNVAPLMALPDAVYACTVAYQSLGQAVP